MPWMFVFDIDQISNAFDSNVLENVLENDVKKVGKTWMESVGGEWKETMVVTIT